MSERKNIDRLFQEKFKDFEAEPSEQSWKNIEARLTSKRKRKVIPFWFKLTGIAAALLIGIFLTNQLGKQDFPEAGNQIVVSPEAKSNSAPTPGSTDEKRNLQINSNTVVRDSQNKSGENSITKVGPTYNTNNKQQNGQYENAVAGELVAKKKSSTGSVSGQASLNRGVAGSSKVFSKGKKGMKGKYEKSADLILNEENQTAIAQNTGGHLNKITETTTVEKSDTRLIHHNPNQTENIEKKVTEIKAQTQIIAVSEKVSDDTLKNDTTAVATVVPNALGELLIEKEQKSVTENGQKINRWQVYTHVAPIYLSSASDGSSIDPTLANNSKDYKTSLSYGAGVSYAIGKKLAIRAGVNSVNLEYNTNDIAFSQNASTRQLKHVDNNISGAMLNIENNAAPTPSESLVSISSKKFSGSLNQKTGYIEVPVELSYKLLDKKFGVDLVGGFSTLFLQQNEVSLLSNGGEIEIGRANNLNNTHFSGNFGLGLKYNILKALQFNVEPMLKYQINTYNSGDFKPFFFGLYTGLNYRF